jgi:hypothetical protein
MVYVIKLQNTALTRAHRTTVSTTTRDSLCCEIPISHSFILGTVLRNTLCTLLMTTIATIYTSKASLKTMHCKIITNICIVYNDQLCTEISILNREL